MNLYLTFSTWQNLLNLHFQINSQLYFEEIRERIAAAERALSLKPLSLLYRNSPKSLRLIMIDPKMLEFSITTTSRTY